MLNHKPNPTTTTELCVEPHHSATAPHIQPEPKRGRLKTWWAETKRDVLADLKSPRLARAGRWFLIYCWMGCLTAALIVVALYGTLFGSFRGSACQPDGSFSIFPFDYYAWGISGFFQITIGFGSLTFTKAKAIDIVWDIAVGRVGQGALAIFSWMAFSIYVRGSMLTAAITYNTFWIIFMNDDASFMSTARIMRDFTTKRGLQSKTAMVFIVISMIYVLAFPTLASAMTGYTTNSAAFVADSQQNLLSFSSFAPVAYVIHDGWRVNLTGDYLVPFRKPDPSLGGPVMWSPTSIRGDYYCYYNVRDKTACSFSQGVSEYVKSYGFLGLDEKGNTRDVETQWMNQTLPKPALNISAFYIERGVEFFGFDWIDPRTGTQPYADSSKIRLNPSGSNETYPPSYIQQSGSCQSLGTYQWGFSFLQVFINLLFLVFWTMGACVMWLKGHFTLAQQQSECNVPLGYRAALDLASTMRREFADTGEVPDTLSQRKLDRHIMESLKGGRIEVQAFSPTAMFSLRKGLWRWIKKDRWWLGMLFLLTCSCIILGVLLWPPVLLTVIFVTAGVFFATMLGTTRKSRLSFALCGVLVGLICLASTFGSHL